MDRESKETVAQSFAGYAEMLLQMGTTLYLLLLFVGLPLYSSEGYRRIGTDKFLFFRNVTQKMGWIGIFLFLLLVIFRLIVLYQQKQMGGEEWSCYRKREKAFWLGLSATDFFVLLYGVALLLSYVFSRHREQASWGAQGWYMGLFTQLLLLGVYFFVSRFWSGKRWHVYVFYGAFALVTFIGILNRFGIYMFEMEGSNPLFISTVGNINWFCGYLVCLFFSGLACVYWEKKEGWCKIPWFLFLFVGFMGLILQGSASGFLALFGVFFFLYQNASFQKERMIPFWEFNILISATALIIFILRKLFPESLQFQDGIIDFLTAGGFPFVWMILSVGMYYLVRYAPIEEKKAKRLLRGSALGIRALVIGGIGLFVVLLVGNTLTEGAFSFLPQSLFTFNDEWGSLRGATWKAGFLSFLQQDFLHKLVGVGPDCMYMDLYFSGNEEMISWLRECFGNAFLTNAHCEWLTVLVNTGILGIVGFGGMMISAMVRFLKSDNVPLVKACGLVVLAYICNNIFSFQQILGISIMMALLGMGENQLRKKRFETM